MRTKSCPKQPPAPSVETETPALDALLYQFGDRRLWLDDTSKVRIACRSDLSRAAEAKARECEELRESAKDADELRLEVQEHNKAEIARLISERDEVSAKLAKAEKAIGTERAMKEGCQKRLLDLAAAVRVGPPVKGEDTVARTIRIMAELSDDNAKLRAELATLREEGKGLPAVGSQIARPSYVVGNPGKSTTVSHYGPRYGGVGFYGIDGAWFDLKDEGKTWRRVPAEPTKGEG
jgi:hypothetical protein